MAFKKAKTSDEESLESDSSFSNEDLASSDDEGKMSDDGEKFQILTPFDINEDVSKGNAVKNQLKLWEKLLEIRIKSHKLIQSCNTVPLNDVYTKLSAKTEFKVATTETTVALISLMEKLYNLKSHLLDQYSPETRSLKRKYNCFDEPDKIQSIEKDLVTADENFRSFRNTVLRKWQDVTSVAVSRKSNQMEVQDIIQKIDNSLANRNGLLEESQTYRGYYTIIGSSQAEPGVALPGIYEDSDFYHNLLRELIEHKTQTEYLGTEQKFHELQSLRQKMKKKVDTRASKGRKIRYVVHNKMINFMAPEAETNGDWTEEAKTELFDSLFDKANT